MLEFKKDNLVVRRYESRAAMGAAAAVAIAGRIREELGYKTHVNIIFAAAPSQNEMLAALIDEDVDWSRINAFHMDEYVGLPEGSPQSFRHYLDGHIFSRVPFRRVYYLNGTVANLRDECFRYADLLTTYPPDLVCMGIGENGHIAFNDPHVADFSDPEQVKVVELDETCRQQQVNDRCFDEIDQVPVRALTLTIPALMAGRYLFCVVPGKKKAQAVYNTLHQPPDPGFPSTILRTHSRAILFVDEESCPMPPDTVF